MKAPIAVMSVFAALVAVFTGRCQRLRRHWAS
jgi:hypothetical protein